MEQVGAAVGTSQKHKRETLTPQPQIDADTWLKEAQQDNDNNAVQWFTVSILKIMPAAKGPQKKTRLSLCLNIQWASLCTLVGGVTRNHLHAWRSKPSYMPTCSQWSTSDA